MYTTSVQIPKSVLLQIIVALVERSIWFRVEPLPENEYELTIKPEHSEWLRNKLNEVI